MKYAERKSRIRGTELLDVIKASTKVLSEFKERLFRNVSHEELLFIILLPARTSLDLLLMEFLICLCSIMALQRELLCPDTLTNQQQMTHPL